MSELGGQDLEVEQPLDREEIVLAQAEIKELLSRHFRHTPLAELFTEPIPQAPVQDVTLRSLKQDFIGTRIVSGDILQGAQERELQVIRKARTIRRSQIDRGIDIGEMIRLVEPGLGSDRQPVIEHLIVEAKGMGGGFRLPHAPNTPSAVNSALQLARAISRPR